jgi:serine-type D-Ala-D-Ala carboxypeptidase (penicillin-binding protein 5/6)
VPPGGPSPGPTRSELRAARRSGDRSRRWLVGLSTAVGVAALAAVLVAFLVMAPASPAKAKPPPTPSLHADRAAMPSLAATDPTLPWPTTGESAVAIPSIGYSSQSGPEQPVPVASMTKVMTAYVLLQDHPLPAGTTPGPPITISTADANDYDTDVASTQANVPLQAGEVLSERQALDGMLVHSANDLAYSLAVWDGGSLPAFLAKMNATAARLGMTETHYVDASGYTPGSVSTAADLLKVASVAMTVPAFAQAVAMPAVTMPVAGIVSTYTPLLPGGVTGPTPNVVGVKSGFTSAAGGGDILAYQATVGGSPLLVLAAVTSQEMATVLHAAGEMDLGLAQSAAGAVQSMPVVTAGHRLGTVSDGGAPVPVVATTSARLLGWPGQTAKLTLIPGQQLRPGDPAGSPAGIARYSIGQEHVTVQLATTARLPSTS